MVFSTQRGKPYTPKPLDGGGGKATDGNVSRMSFKDKVPEGKSVPPKSGVGDLIIENLFQIELQDGNRLIPKCYMDSSVLNDFFQPWEDALIIKLLGKSVGYMTRTKDGGGEHDDTGIVKTNPNGETIPTANVTSYSWKEGQPNQAIIWTSKPIYGSQNHGFVSSKSSLPTNLNFQLSTCGGMHVDSVDTPMNMWSDGTKTTLSMEPLSHSADVGMNVCNWCEAQWPKKPPNPSMEDNNNTLTSMEKFQDCEETGCQ
ncbi:hypothetical protein SESBI_30607 [Sesbania bispinosa]|nr:hypothetical protein SESBI_30607 [Sesbania bispinosa]